MYVDHKFNFKTHIEDSIVRAKQRSALIFRDFLSRNIHHLNLAFISYIRPLLENASPVWSPSLIYLNDTIESVQRSYTKRLPGFDKLTYSERFQKLKLQSLTTDAAHSLVRALIHTRIDYCNGLLAAGPKYLHEKLQSVFRAAARLVLQLPHRSSVSGM